MTKKDIFLDNLKGECTSTIPVWMMRQAGRYMAEYQNLREKYTFEKICKTPDIAAEVTCQPMEKFDFDAAIIFSDILYIVEPFGFKLTYDPGPKIEPHLTGPSMASKFVPYDPADYLGYVGEGIVEVKRRLGPDYPMIGFCGAPFTIFCYLCGVMGAKDYHKPYQFLSNYPSETAVILDAIAEVSLDYLKLQIQAGADFVQVFDTFAGELSEQEFRIWSMPYLQKIFDGLKDHGKGYSGLFIRNSNHLLKAIAEINLDCFSVDWKTSLTEAAQLLKPKCVQGNLNPYLMPGPRERVLEQTHTILTDMNSVPGYIFNLGHGILPNTAIENVTAVVEAVHSFRRK